MLRVGSHHLLGLVPAVFFAACAPELADEGGEFEEIGFSTSALTAATYLDRKTDSGFVGASDPSIRQNEADAYYGTWRAPSTLDDFKRQYGFFDAPGDETSATYFNAGDLGFGREMHCIWVDSKLQGACYVTNYGEASGRATFGNDPRRSLENAVSRHGAFATVAMAFDYNVKPQSFLQDASFDGKYQVNFVAYGADGRQAKEAQLDSVGYNKAIPQNCTNCHGGRYDSASNLVTGATFLPFDLSSFQYSERHGFRRQDQEESLRKANWIVWMVNEHLNPDVSNPMSVKSTLEGWYPGGGLWSQGATFYDGYLPAGWSSSPDIYRNVVAQYCRGCHLTNAPNLEASAAPALVTSNVCGSSHPMPIAEVPLLRLFQSQAPSLLLTQVSGGESTCEAPSFLNLRPDTGNPHGPGNPQGTGTCLYYHRSTQRTDYQDYFGRAHSCTVGSPDGWRDQCREGQNDTEENACVPGSPAPRLNGSCQYRDRRSHAVGPYDARGETHACTLGDRGIWYEQCRDRVDNTEEIGCVQTFGF